ncbi:MAG TPA: hypothetical protein VFV19_00895 [Candidatus Polarisedimenticolaceae bacterium]|nr:hypothetical protein [Candidatus Polarisedimenticolaceae bacterium]
MRASRSLLVLGLGLGLLGTGGVRAETLEYAIEVKDGQPATFEVPFAVPYVGTVVLDAQWTGPRLLFFGVDLPGHPGFGRRSGPSPQRVQFQATDPDVVNHTGFRLTIKALPARGEATGRLKITVPDSPEVVAAREAILHPPPPPPPPPPAWTLAKAAPANASADMAALFRAVETYRAGVLANGEHPVDDCRWQIDFLIDATAMRDRLAAGGAPPDVPALRYFGRITDVIGSVESLRSSKDPILAGPVPGDVNDRRAWLVARYELTRPIERSLDQLGELLKGGHAPSLEKTVWVPRLTACVMASERYFDERVKLGSDEDASNRELTRAQWPHIQSASAVLRALAPWLREPEASPR